jgi:hypothetical protein
MNVEKILKSLAHKKPIFRSEKELQYALSDEIESLGFKCQRNGTVLGSKVDILVEDSDGGYFAIHLRNKTAKFSATVKGALYELKQHGAQDQGRYDFLSDVEALEKLTRGRSDVKGYVLLITNDHLYWTRPIKVSSVDEDFHLHDTRKITGELQWSMDASKGTQRNREDKIHLDKEYKCEWKRYSYINSNQNGTFEYLLIEV